MKQNDSDKLFEAFERLSLDPKLHFFIQTQKGEPLKIEFNRSKKLPWSVSLVDNIKETKRQISRHKLREVLNAIGSDIQMLEAEVSSHLLLQCAFCDQLIRESTELLGEVAVRDSIYNTQRMMDDLTESVLKTLGNADFAAPSVESASQKSENRANLRIIRGS